MPRRQRNQPAGDQPPEDLPEVDPAAGDASGAEDDLCPLEARKTVSPLEPRKTALWSPQFLSGLPTDSEAAVRRTLEVLREDYSIEGVSVPDPHPDFVATLVRRLPRSASTSRIPELVVYGLVVDSDDKALAPYSSFWRPLAQRAIEERLMLRVSDCYELFDDGTGRFRIVDEGTVHQGMVIDFGLIAHLPEISPMTLAKRMLMDLLGRTCRCTHRATPGQRGRARKKCRRDHLLRRWRDREVWPSQRLWQFLDQAALGFSWAEEHRRRATFLNGAFHSGMLASLLDPFLAKANVVQRWCPRCHQSLSGPCDLDDCPLGSKPLDELPFRGRPDWLILHELGKCSLCGGILTADELGEPCPGRPTGGGEEGSSCGARDFEPAQEWFQELSLWKCAACSEHFEEDRFFLARRCVVNCPPDGEHDRCPGLRQGGERLPEACETVHSRASGFRLCYWRFYVPPGLRPQALPPPRHNQRPLGQPGEADDNSQGGLGAERATTMTSAGDNGLALAEEPGISEQEGQTILAAALDKVVGEFRGYRRAACRILARDLRHESYSIRRRAVRFLFAAAATGGPACQPADADYRYLHAELAIRNRASDLPEAAAALRLAWNERGHGLVVATWVRWHLDLIVVCSTLAQCAQDATGWRQVALDKLAKSMRQAKALLADAVGTPRQERATEGAFAWLHSALVKDRRCPDLPATPAALRQAWRLDVEPALRNAPWVRWHLDLIVVCSTLAQCAREATGWRQVALDKLAKSMRQAKALLADAVGTPRQEPATEAAFAWLHSALVKDRRCSDLPATLEALRQAWRLDVEPALRNALSHYRRVQGATKPRPGSASEASPGRSDPS